MKSIAFALVAVLICLGIGSAFGSPGGGFIVGVVLAIMLMKRYGSVESNSPA